MSSPVFLPARVLESHRDLEVGLAWDTLGLQMWRPCAS